MLDVRLRTTLPLILSVFSILPARSQVLPARTSPEPASQSRDPSATKTPDPLGRQTPAGCVKGFVAAVTSKNYAKAARYLQLTPSMIEDQSQIVLQLMAVFDSGSVDPARLSNETYGRVNDELGENRDLIGKVVTPDKEYDLQVVRVDDREFGLIWLIAKETVSNVPAMYQGINTGFRSQLPSWLRQHRFLTLELWQWMGLVLLIAISLIAGRYFGRLIVHKLAIGIATPYGLSMVQTVERIHTPFQWCIAILIYQAGARLLFLPLVASIFANRTSTVLLILLFTWLVVRLVDIFSERLRLWLLLAERVGAISILPMMRRFAKVLIAAAGLLVMFEAFGISAASVWAGLGIGGIAVALAAQKTVENLFGGASLLADQPIRVGDVCRFENQVGTVEDIGLRSTRVRTPQRTVVSVPNGSFATMQLENLSKRDKLLFSHRVQVTYNTTSDLMRYLLVEIRKLLYSHSMVDPDPARVRFVAFGPYSLDIEIFAYVKTPDNNEFLAVQEDLLLRIMALVEQSGAVFAFPSQTTYLAREYRPDQERINAAEKTVHVWRERGELSLPHFSRDQIERLRGSIEYPVDGSVLKA